jgi:hypothetical protein
MKQGTQPRLLPTPQVSLDELAERSKHARRVISGDVEWTAVQFREFMTATRDLCNVVERYVDQNTVSGTEDGNGERR